MANQSLFVRSARTRTIRRRTDMKHADTFWGCLLVIGAASVGCSGTGSDGASAGSAAPAAESVVPDAVLVRDINNDGVADVAIRTKSGDGFLTTKLLNQGGGVFERWDSSDTDEGLPELSGSAWVLVETASTQNLLRSVPGYANALSNLPSDSLVALGVGSVSKLQPQDSSVCHAGWICFWQNSSYSGLYLMFTHTNSNANIGSWFNDRMTSYWNRTRNFYGLFQESNYQGVEMCAKSSSSSAAVPSGFNDRMTSFRIHSPHDFCQY